VCDKAGTRKLHVTPDGRYVIVKGRLWRCTNPSLALEIKTILVNELMQTRREKGIAMRRDDIAGRDAARQRINEIKQQLGERSPVWWSDGAPDWNQHMAKTRLCRMVCSGSESIIWTVRGGLQAVTASPQPSGIRDTVCLLNTIVHSCRNLPRSQA
jgi:hypothetical protein